MKLNEKAQAYESPETKNICELETVETDLEISSVKFKEGTPDEFEIDVIEVEGEQYRVPASVLKALKVHLEETPSLKYFKVKKSGEGMKTAYTVIPQA